MYPSNAVYGPSSNLILSSGECTIHNGSLQWRVVLIVTIAVVATLIRTIQQPLGHVRLQPKGFRQRQRRYPHMRIIPPIHVRGYLFSLGGPSFRCRRRRQRQSFWDVPRYYQRAKGLENTAVLGVERLWVVPDARDVGSTWYGWRMG